MSETPGNPDHHTSGGTDGGGPERHAMHADMHMDTDHEHMDMHAGHHDMPAAATTTAGGESDARTDRADMDGTPMDHPHGDAHTGHHDMAGMDMGGMGGMHMGPGGHAHHVERFRRLFWVMLVLSVPVVAFSPATSMLLGHDLVDATWASWVAPLLGTVMYVWGGSPFLQGAVGELRSRRPGMMLLVAMAITVAFLSSWAASLHLVDHALDFWWELALLVVIMLLGHWLEMRSLAQTGSALDSLAALLPDTAELVTAEGTTTVAPADLHPGDVVVVRPGGRVPADGRVVQGHAAVDESLVTGESRPVERHEGDRVVAGTVATDSGLRVEVTAVGEDTALAGIRRLVEQAQSSTSRAQRLADRAAALLFWFALAAAVLSAIVWAVVGTPAEALTRAITVLVIACPHALGLAIPLVVSIATGRAALGGILIRDRLSLETMRTVDTVVFDKTGTLTEGRPALTGIDTDGHDDEVLALAAAAESDSEHPLARAILAAAGSRGLDVPAATDFTSSPAVGVDARVGGRRVQVGGPGLLEREKVAPRAGAQQWRDEGATVLHVLVDGSPVGALRLADAVRPESRRAVEALQGRGVEVVMVTGDAESVAASVSAELGITRHFAGVRPEGKSDIVARLQSEGRRVAMVGDGVNDAPALARADVGIAIGAGTDVAIASAGVVLASDDPRSVVSVMELSRATYRKMQQNLWWAAGYNLVAVPLAAGVLAPIGVVMPMSVGAVLMSLSTVLVALNAQTLRRLDLSPEAVAPLEPTPRTVETVAR